MDEIKIGPRDRVNTNNSLWVFPNTKGNKLKDIRKSWNAARRKAKIGYGYKISEKYAERYAHLPKGPYYHDFRKTAARNLVRAGVPDGVAMKITGHETRSVFDRYNITDDRDLQMAAQRQQEYLENPHGHNLGTIFDFENIKESNTNGLPLPDSVLHALPFSLPNKKGPEKQTVLKPS